MKRALRFLAVGAMLLLAICFISCGNEISGDIELSIKEGVQPKSTFVLGQDVTLTGGVLLAKSGGTRSCLPPP